ncbi:ribose-5-phosphate isomerase RpiA [Aestuariivirga sp.]|uniref:ribose-5-phosphate isomerase RpiA n=1 Tax=Aestuariivirga sp. TaxID=2650926 RepID=UPI0039197A51
MTADQQKKAAAVAALDYIQPGMKVGLGTGSTANHFITALADKARAGFDVECVATSKQSFELARRLGLKLTTLEQQPRLHVTVDGADEFDGNFQLIKGGGGALLLEKIVASSSRFMIVIADQSKKVETLGKFPLPVEVVPFGVNATAWKIERALRILNLQGKLVLRLKEGKPFVTDSGNAIIDVSIGAIPDPNRLDNLLSIIPGVVDHGLFIDICGIVLMGTDEGVRTLRKE